jgi:hypothetical protein
LPIIDVLNSFRVKKIGVIFETNKCPFVKEHIPFGNANPKTLENRVKNEHKKQKSVGEDVQIGGKKSFIPKKSAPRTDRFSHNLSLLEHCGEKLPAMNVFYYAF